jgi:hypothetical protein
VCGGPVLRRGRDPRPHEEFDSRVEDCTEVALRPEQASSAPPSARVASVVDLAAEPVEVLVEPAEGRVEVGGAR